ncbi:MAG: hypothetical protein PWP70_1141, partial [Moorella sp. (in: firmicutes)]|nr:hypothetical protein [Moorella sp. (in: firmicutes)]
MSLEKIRILIADDQALMCDGLKTILELEADMEVVGTAADGQETWAMVQHLTPDVVLLDVRMPVMDGVECVRLIKEQFLPIKVIMLTTFDDEDYILPGNAPGEEGRPPGGGHGGSLKPGSYGRNFCLHRLDGQPR